jgi:NAD(P)-dependent dehydrogenase (short-subunit alcohol dehydrogenase family)
MNDRYEDDLMEDLMTQPQAGGHAVDEYDEADDDALDEADELDEAEEFDEADEFEEADGYDAAEAYDAAEEYDAADELEEAMTDALEAEDEDEFFGGFGKILRKVGRTAGSIARRVAPIAKLIPLPQAQLIGRAADMIGNVLADEGDEFDSLDSLDALADLAEEEDGFDALAPVVAGLAIRGALKHKVAKLPREHRRQLVKTVATATKQIARKHGAAAAIAAPAIVRAARKIVLRKRLPVKELPRVVKGVARLALRSPRTLRTLVRAGTRLRSLQPGHRRRHRGAHQFRRTRRGSGGLGLVGSGMSGAPVTRLGGAGRLRSAGGSLARPEEIASAALFLASDQSSYVAGIDLPVDGGLTAV